LGLGVDEACSGHWGEHVVYFKKDG
jgi:hypothetical protein